MLTGDLLWLLIRSEPLILVLRAELTEVLKNKSVLYVEVKLPKGFRVFTHTIESARLEWNRKFDL